MKGCHCEKECSKGGKCEVRDPVVSVHAYVGWTTLSTRNREFKTKIRMNDKIFSHLYRTQETNDGKNDRERKVEREKTPREFDAIYTTKGRCGLPFALDRIPLKGVPKSDEVDSD